MKIAIATVISLCVVSASCKTPEGAASAISADPVSADETKLKGDYEYIGKDAGRMVRDSHAKLGKPANRDFHSKGICLKGTFTVTPGRVDVADVALFATAASYPMYGRFSNGRPGRDSNDHDPSVFGFGVKVVGAPGDKFDMQSLGSTKPKNANLDWNLATGRTFAIPTAAVYREQREADAKGKLATAAFAVRHPFVVKALLSGLSYIDAFTVAAYHSQVAFHFGEKRIAKFSAVPCGDEKPNITKGDAAKRSGNYLRENLATEIQKNGGCFVFGAQIRPSDDQLPASQKKWASDYPSNNPTIAWPADVIPFVPLAKIEFPKQNKIAELQPTCETLSFNPGNTLQSLRPIESDTLNRARFLHAYEGSVVTRLGINAAPQNEPTVAGDVKAWLVE